MVLDNIFIKYTYSSIIYVNFGVVLVTFLHGNGKELLGVKGPPNNSKTIISLCNQVVLVKVNIHVCTIM